MQPAERPEFEKQIGVLFAAIDKPLTEERREAFWKGCLNMSLLDVGRCINRVLEDLQENPAPRFFTVGDLWAAKRKLRAAGPYVLAPQDPNAGKFDPWAIAANFHLAAHIRKALSRNSRRYGDPGNYVSGRQESREFRANVARLVEAKNAWAADMRDLAAHNAGEVPVLQQREIWNDYLKSAEAQIANAHKQAA